MRYASISRGRSTDETASSGQERMHELGIEPSHLERADAQGGQTPCGVRGAKKRELKRAWLIASLPVLALPACLASTPREDAAMGLDNGTVGQVESSCESPAEEVA